MKQVPSQFFFHAIIFIAIFLIGYLAGSEDLFAPTQDININKELSSSEAIPSKESVTLIIDFGDNATTTPYNIPWNKNMSAFDLLVYAKENYALSLEYQDYGDDLGIFVKQIQGKPAVLEESTVWWQYFINGEYATVGAGSYILSPNDTVVWKLTGDQFNQ